MAIRIWLLSVLLVLSTGCSDHSSPDTEAGNRLKKDGKTLDELQSIYADTEFKVLDISEREWKGKNALAITLSVPLDPKSDFQPYLAVNQVRGKSIDGAWILSDDKRVLYFTATQPRTAYEVTAFNGLPALTGKTLSARISQQITTRDIRPALSFASQGSVLPAHLSNGIPVTLVNVKEANIDFHHIDTAHIADFFRHMKESYNHQFYRYDQLRRWGEMVYSGRFKFDAPDNTLVKRAIAVEDITQLQQPGLYVAVMDEVGSYDYNRYATYFVVSDIGLQVRQYANTMVVLASSLSDGKALGNLSVAIMDGKGNLLQERKTSPEGEAEFSGNLQSGSFLLAQSEQQIALLELTGPALDLSEFDLGNRPQNPQEAFIYTPRDLYRPGEAVDFNILLRDGNGFPGQQQTLNIQVHQPNGQLVQQALLSAQDMDYYAWRLALPSNAATGNWRFDVTSLAGGQVSYPFKVEEFLPERMTLQFNAGKQEPLQFDATAQVQIPINGMYLYGAPAAGNRLSHSVQVGLSRQPLPQYKGYYFGNELEADASQTFDLPDQFLDTGGNALVAFDSRWAAVRSPLQLQLLSSLFESGGRAVVRSYRTLVWPGNDQLGVRPSFGDKFPEADSVVDFNLISVNGKGELQAADNVQVNLVREDRHYYWEYNDNEGWHYAITDKEYVERSQTLPLQASTENKISFHVDWGRYRLEVKNPQTGAITSLRFHAGEDWYRWWKENQKAQKSVRPDAVTLALDKGAYQAGDMATLRINSPHAGDAIVMVEADKPLWFKRIHLDKPDGSVEIPVAKDWNRHDIYVSVVVLRAASRQEQITPNRAFGLIHLPLDHSDRQLQLTLNTPEKVLPETDLHTDISVHDANGKPFAHGYVSLAAVDVGVLNISNFKTPDPIDGFFGRRRYGTDIRDLYGKVIELNNFDKAGIRFGGDADLSRGGKAPQSEVQIVSLFQKPIHLDDKGMAKVDLPLPYFNGKLRLMALAFGASQFGSAAQETTVAAPLVTQLSLPRFLAPGDRATAAFDLHNLSGKPQALQVQITTDGGLEKTTQTLNIDLAQDAKTTLPFAITGANLQQGLVLIRVSGEDFDPLERGWKIGLRPAYPAEVRQTSEVLDPGANFTLPATLLDGLDLAGTEMRLSLGNKADLNLPVHIAQLLHYPYGCLEQTSSGAFPYALASEQNQARFNMSPVSAQQRAERIEYALTHIAGMQLNDGGFGLWDDHSPEEHWLTAYVTDFMLNVQEQGYPVPQTMLNKALSRLTAYVNRSGSLFEQRYTNDMEHYRFAYKAYAAYVLARVNQAPLASLRTLHDRLRSNSKSGLPLLHLGIALQLAGDQQRADQALKEGLIKTRSNQDYLADYGSPVRDQAMMIYLLLKHQLHTDQALTLSYSLANDLRAQTWLSTQERNALFMAGVMLESITSESWMARLRVGDSEQQFAQAGNAYRKFAGAGLLQSLQVNNSGNARLFASAQVSGYPLDKPAVVEDGYQIQRQYFSADGKALDLQQLHTGELVIVHLEVVSDTAAPDSLVIDLIPAGFELENQNLQHAVKLDDFRIDGKTIKQLQDEVKVLHQEYRDDRYVAAMDLRRARGHLFYLMRAVTPGSYRVPPPMVEDMYRAARRAVGETISSVKVLPR